MSPIRRSLRHKIIATSSEKIITTRTTITKRTHKGKAEKITEGTRQNESEQATGSSQQAKIVEKRRAAEKIQESLVSPKNLGKKGVLFQENVKSESPKRVSQVRNSIRSVIHGEMIKPPTLRSTRSIEKSEENVIKLLAQAKREMSEEEASSKLVVKENPPKQAQTVKRQKIVEKVEEGQVLQSHSSKRTISQAKSSIEPVQPSQEMKKPRVGQEIVEHSATTQRNARQQVSERSRALSVPVREPIRRRSTRINQNIEQNEIESVEPPQGEKTMENCQKNPTKSPKISKNIPTTPVKKGDLEERKEDDGDSSIDINPADSEAGICARLIGWEFCARARRNIRKSERHKYTWLYIDTLKTQMKIKRDEEDLEEDLILPYPSWQETLAYLERKNMENKKIAEEERREERREETLRRQKERRRKYGTLKPIPLHLVKNPYEDFWYKPRPVALQEDKLWKFYGSPLYKIHNTIRMKHRLPHRYISNIKKRIKRVTDNDDCSEEAKIQHLTADYKEIRIATAEFKFEITKMIGEDEEPNWDTIWFKELQNSNRSLEKAHLLSKRAHKHDILDQSPPSSGYASFGNGTDTSNFLLCEKQTEDENKTREKMVSRNLLESDGRNIWLKRRLLYGSRRRQYLDIHNDPWVYAPPKRNVLLAMPVLEPMLTTEITKPRPEGWVQPRKEVYGSWPTTRPFSPEPDRWIRSKSEERPFDSDEEDDEEEYVDWREKVRQMNFKPWGELPEFVDAKFLPPPPATIEAPEVSQADFEAALERSRAEKAEKMKELLRKQPPRMRDEKSPESIVLNSSPEPEEETPNLLQAVVNLCTKPILPKDYIFPQQVVSQILENMPFSSGILIGRYVRPEPKQRSPSPKRMLRRSKRRSGDPEPETITVSPDREEDEKKEEDNFWPGNYEIDQEMGPLEDNGPEETQSIPETESSIVSQDRTEPSSYQDSDFLTRTNSTASSMNDEVESACNVSNARELLANLLARVPSMTPFVSPPPEPTESSDTASGPLELLSSLLSKPSEAPKNPSKDSEPPATNSRIRTISPRRTYQAIQVSPKGYKIKSSSHPSPGRLTRSVILNRTAQMAEENSKKEERLTSPASRLRFSSNKIMEKKAVEVKLEVKSPVKIPIRSKSKPLLSSEKSESPRRRAATSIPIAPKDSANSSPLRPSFTQKDPKLSRVTVVTVPITPKEAVISSPLRSSFTTKDSKSPRGGDIGMTIDSNEFPIRKRGRPSKNFKISKEELLTQTSSSPSRQNDCSSPQNPFKKRKIETIEPEEVKQSPIKRGRRGMPAEAAVAAAMATVKSNERAIRRSSGRLAEKEKQLEKGRGIKMESQMEEETANEKSVINEDVVPVITTASRRSKVIPISEETKEAIMKSPPTKRKFKGRHIVVDAPATMDAVNKLLQNATDAETRREKSTSFEKIMDHEFGTVFTSPSSKLPVNTRFDAAASHPKSRARRNAAIKKAEQEALKSAEKRKDTQRYDENVGPFVMKRPSTPDTVTLSTAGTSREGSVASASVDEAQSERGSTISSCYANYGSDHRQKYLYAPKKFLLHRAKEDCVQSDVLTERQSTDDEVQLVSPPPRDNSPDIIILEPTPSPSPDIKAEEQDPASPIVIRITDPEYDEDGVDDPPVGAPLIYACDFMGIDQDEISLDALPFPPDAARVDAKCFKELILNLTSGKKCAPLPRMTNRYAYYSQDIIPRLINYQPMSLKTEQLQVALEDPTRLFNDCLRVCSAEAMSILTRATDAEARKNQLVTSNKIKELMTMYLENRKDLLEELCRDAFKGQKDAEKFILEDQFNTTINNVQIAICDSLLSLCEETQAWNPSTNVIKRRFEAFLFGWRNFILSGGPLKVYMTEFHGKMPKPVEDTLNKWMKRLDKVIKATSILMKKRPVERATELIARIEKDPGMSCVGAQWEAALADVMNAESKSHIHKCDTCKIWFSKEKLCITHKKVHEFKPYECSVDFLSFTHKLSLYLHSIHRHMKEILTGEIDPTA